MGEAEAELSFLHEGNQLLIEKARTSLLAFVLATKEDYVVNWHHLNLMKKLTQFAMGEIKYLMVFMPPRHGKSEIVSRKLPAWLHGLYPDDEIMAASYSHSLSSDMIVAIQDTMSSPIYKQIFPGVELYPPNVKHIHGKRNTEEHHIMGRRGKYRGQGVGGQFTGKGANWIIIDDPIKGREQADSVTFREKLWEFYNNDLYSRLETNLKTGREGQVLITQCMTGDTQVLLSDGSEKALLNIRPGDKVATFEDGKVTESIVEKWKNNGPDLVRKIKTTSGITVKANDRHPFLVCRDEVLVWVRLKDLKINDRLIRVGECGRVKHAQLKDANKPQSAKATVSRTTIKQGGPQESGHHQLTMNQDGAVNYDTDMVLNQKITTKCLKNKITSVLSVVCRQPQELTCPSIGKKCALTTITQPERLEVCCATNATSLLSTEIPKKSYLQQLNIYEDTIVSITDAGYEDVFDVQIARTENFIANNLVSHNTRWHEDDLAGRLLELMKKDPKSTQWQIVNYPAVRVTEDDPTDPRQIGEPLWPQKYSLQKLNEIESTIGGRAWGSLYQQNPVPDGGAIFKRTMFEFGLMPRMGEFDYMYITADTAYTSKQHSDFTVFTCFGVIQDQLYIVGVWREQIDSASVEMPARKFITGYMGYGFRNTWIEPKGHGIYLNQKFAQTGVNIPDSQSLSEFFADRRFDKVTRANNVVPHLAHRKVIINELIPEKNDLVNECLGFPYAAHDDFVDTLIDGLKLMYGKALSIYDII